MKTKIVVDIKKVQYASFYYKNQAGQKRTILSRYPTVYSVPIQEGELAAYHTLYPGETLLERAKRLDIIDVWIPVVVLQFAANHSVTYTGKKAKDIWKAWQSYIFGKK